MASDLFARDIRDLGAMLEEEVDIGGVDEARVNVYIDAIRGDELIYR